MNLKWWRGKRSQYETAMLKIIFIWIFVTQDIKGYAKELIKE